MTPQEIVVRRLGRVDYHDSFRAMQAFTAQRTPATPDEIWLLEHAPVYTMGLKGHGRTDADIRGISIVQSDRGGDITFHGPGQLVGYVLVDIVRRGIGIKRFVTLLEQAVINLLGEFGIEAQRRTGAPGVYVQQRKIAALGLRVRNGATYHGLALNVDLELAPFHWIDPCGYPGLDVTSLRDLGVNVDVEHVATALATQLAGVLGYTRQRLIDFPIAPEVTLHE